MANKPDHHLFAILYGKAEVRRVGLSQELQTTVWNHFEALSVSFVNQSTEVLPFDPSLRPDEDHVIEVAHFSVPQQIAAALANPMVIPKLDVATGALDVVGLFMGHMAPATRILFQPFGRRQVLQSSKFNFIQRQGTLTRLEEPGVTLADALCATISGDRLLLRSYAAVSRLLDLSEFYRDATDAEVAEFASHPVFHCSDPVALRHAADTWVRRKIAILSKRLDSLAIAPSQARTAAKAFGLSIDIKKVSGKERIALPSDRAALKELLRFLDEDYYQSPLTSAKYVSHSKRQIAGHKG